MTNTLLTPRLANLHPKVQNMVLMLHEATSGNRKYQRLLRDAAMNPSMAQEALSTSDFANLFQVAINAQAQARYTEVPVLWDKWAERTTVQGLRKQDFYDLFADLSNLPAQNGGAKTYEGGLPRIPEGTPYPAISFGSTSESIWTYKVGARIHFTLEAFENDDWGLIQRLPDDLNRAASRTEDLSGTAALFDENGFRNDVWGGAVTEDKPLNYTNLVAALGLVTAQPAVGSRINTIPRFTLMVGRGMEMTANTIINAVQVETKDNAGNKFVINNNIGSMVELVVNPYINSVFTASASYQNTAWCLLPYAGQGSDRTSVVQVFKNGAETPELRIKADTGRALGGGELDPFAGSFDYDDTQVRIRHYTNTMVVDSSIGFYASKGDGS